MTTPFMGLPIPQVLTTKGPDYASQINQSLTLIDSHDHTPGKGVRIGVAALNINADLSLNGYNLTQIRAARLINESTALATPFDVTSVYAMEGDLYYNNAANVPVQLTAGNSLNAASVGGIGGDYATSSASVNYSSTTRTFAFFSSSGTRAFMDCGHINVNAALPDVPYIALNIPNIGSATLTFDPTDTILSTSIKPPGSTSFIMRNILHYSATTSGTTPALVLCENSATDPVPVLVGQLTSFVVQDIRVPLQVATNGSNTESYVGANKDSALGVGLGYLNASVAGASTLGGTGGVVRMFGTDPLYFATQNTIAGLMDNNGNWGFSGGGLTTLLTSARVQVLASAGQDGLRLDTASGSAASISLSSGGTTKWNISAASSGPLTVTDATGTRQPLVLDNDSTLTFAPTSRTSLVSPIHYAVNTGQTTSQNPTYAKTGTALFVTVNPTVTTFTVVFPIVLVANGTLTDVFLPCGPGLSSTVSLVINGSSVATQTSTSTVGGVTGYHFVVSVAFLAEVTTAYLTLGLMGGSSTYQATFGVLKNTMSVARYPTVVSI